MARGDCNSAHCDSVVGDLTSPVYYFVRDHIVGSLALPVQLLSSSIQFPFISSMCIDEIHSETPFTSRSIKTTH